MTKLPKLSSILLLVLIVSEGWATNKAHSYQHFHGPVSGHHQKITWLDKHGHHHDDYVAEPSYKFSYGVHDHHTKDMHEHKEHRQGKYVSGEYTIHEPGGNVRTVKYHSDEDGFHAHVHNSGPTGHHY
ncbi:cuticle protein 19-like [Venturia canescens]|uniref:cuticle protein 19-like n=1 Tax=Venturia canescens TaxID=32260 RepID=UPI001C9C2795|nr:cuticle protein 19-like [Venturia canescens]